MIANDTEARSFIAGLGGKEAIAKLEVLAEGLKAENARQNLVSKGSLEEGWVRHVADSAQLLPHVPRETRGAWFDLGSGAKARAEITAAFRVSTSSRRFPSISQFASSSLRAIASNHSIRRLRDSTRTVGSSGRRSASTRPGKPAPLPRSNQAPFVSRGTCGMSWAESAK